MPKEGGPHEKIAVRLARNDLLFVSVALGSAIQVPGPPNRVFFGGFLALQNQLKHIYVDVIFTCLFMMSYVHNIVAPNNCLTFDRCCMVLLTVQ